VDELQGVNYDVVPSSLVDYVCDVCGYSGGFNAIRINGDGVIRCCLCRERAIIRGGPGAVSSVGQLEVYDASWVTGLLRDAGVIG